MMVMKMVVYDWLVVIMLMFMLVRCMIHHDAIQVTSHAGIITVLHGGYTSTEES